MRSRAAFSMLISFRAQPSAMVLPEVDPEERHPAAAGQFRTPEQGAVAAEDTDDFTALRRGVLVGDVDGRVVGQGEPVGLAGEQDPAHPVDVEPVEDDPGQLRDVPAAGMPEEQDATITGFGGHARLPPSGRRAPSSSS